MVRPILADLETAFVEYAADVGEPAGFNTDDFRAALRMFFDVSFEMLWNYHKRLGTDISVVDCAATRFANEMHTIIFNYLDIDTYKLYK